MCNIIPRTTQNLQDRRFTLMAKLMNKRPSTINFLKEQLNNLCSEKGYSLEMNNQNCTWTVKLALGNKNRESAINYLIKSIVPANMVTNIVVMYNRYEVLKNLTYSQIGMMTHAYIREEK